MTACEKSLLKKIKLQSIILNNAVDFIWFYKTFSIFHAIYLDLFKLKKDINSKDDKSLG